jgi:hypothetical protein
MREVFRIGFTGGRRAPTDAQVWWLTRVMGNLDASGFTAKFEFHHGDCVGKDELGHNLAKKFGWKVVVHPPSDPRLRAFCTGDVILPPKPYLDRDFDIVCAAEFLFAVPDGLEENMPRSGTWATVRMARSRGIPILAWSLED